mmetsp:Transcript_69276/g.122600  ORF Transcript_69276/g.122600 Transcript_69276/m.122600 type:complete len:106 (-) Transcript_69276:1107-1424(-)
MPSSWICCQKGSYRRERAGHALGVNLRSLKQGPGNEVAVAGLGQVRHNGWDRELLEECHLLLRGAVAKCSFNNVTGAAMVGVGEKVALEYFCDKFLVPDVSMLQD